MLEMLEMFGVLFWIEACFALVDPQDEKKFFCEKLCEIRSENDEEAAA